MSETLKTWQVYKLLDEWNPEDKPIVIRNTHNLNMYEFYYNEEANTKTFKSKNNKIGRLNSKLHVNVKWEILDEDYEAEKRKWEKWGRKVYEWRVGDIVREIKSGKFGEIENLELGCNHIFVSFRDHSFSNEELEMVCLVENRIDVEKS